MKRIQFFATLFALCAALSMSSCLHIIEEMTVQKDGSGTYSMTIDMSEIKSMMAMFKGMSGDDGEEEIVLESPDEGNEIMEDEEGEVVDVVIDRSVEEEVMEEEDGGLDDMMGGDADPSKLGEEFATMAETLKNVKGLSNVVPINDTTNYKFGYSFSFQDLESLNNGLALVNKEKFGAKAENVFSGKKKRFERSGAANFGEEMKRALSEGDGEEGMEESMGMMKMFFADMSYKQIYHFERKIKKSSNKNSALSDDNHTLTIEVKPFAEDGAGTDVATEVKLK